MTGDTITIIRARRRRLAKFVGSDGAIVSYDSARLFDFTTHPVADLSAVGELLADLLSQSNAAVLRGEVADPTRASRVRRLLYADNETGDEPTLRDVPRRWVALDMEDIPRPPDVPPADLAGCAAIALNWLPDAFSEAACVVQASGSHGFKPDIRLRLWFWLDRPMTGAELKRWLDDTPADPAVFGAAQVIYTAAPIMAEGVIDPIPARLTTLPGAAAVKAPSAAELTPVKHETALPKPIFPELVSRYTRAALVKSAARIMSAEKRHPAIIRECRGLARLVQNGMLPESDLRLVITAAAKSRGKDDDTEIERCIAWGLANPVASQMPGVNHA